MEVIGGWRTQTTVFNIAWIARRRRSRAAGRSRILTGKVRAMSGCACDRVASLVPSSQMAFQKLCRYTGTVFRRNTYGSPTRFLRNWTRVAGRCGIRNPNPSF
jgi:hypothetical protein